MSELEHSRDEWAAMCGRYKQERDELLEHLREIKEYGTEEINAAVELRQKLAHALVDLDNMQDQRDLAMKVIKRLECEREEARKIASELAIQAERLRKGRDDAREQVKELIYIAGRAIELAEIDYENDKFGVVSELRNDLEKIKESK